MNDKRSPFGTPPHDFLSQYGLFRKPEQYELTIHQGGEAVKLQVADNNMIDILRAALKSDCGVHVVKVKQ